MINPVSASGIRFHRPLAGQVEKSWILGSSTQQLDKFYREDIVSFKAGFDLLEIRLKSRLHLERRISNCFAFMSSHFFNAQNSVFSYILSSRNRVLTEMKGDAFVGMIFYIAVPDHNGNVSLTTD